LESGSFILENQQLDAEENKIIDNAFFVQKMHFVVLKRHFCEPFVSFL
jgi:hypothetical protein